MKIRVFCLLMISIFILPGCYGGKGIPIYNGHRLFGPRNQVVVYKGDTLYSISQEYNVEMKDLIAVNSLKPPYILKVGQSLRLPKSKYHTVEKGDTLYAISKKYNTDVTTLSRVNHLRSSDLAVGQKILIPSGTIKYAEQNTSLSKQQMKTANNNINVKSTSKTNLSNNKEQTAKNQKTQVANRTPVAAQKKTQSTSYKNVSKNRKNKFAWPVKGTVIAKFGAQGKGVNNDGINIKAAKGTAVKAADAGTVAYSGNGLKGYGNLILIKHNDGWITAYAHNDKMFVKKGQVVKKGEKIASVGTTGGVKTPQLHFETRAGKNAVNPISHLQ